CAHAATWDEGATATDSRAPPDEDAPSTYGHIPAQLVLVHWLMVRVVPSGWPHWLVHCEMFPPPSMHVMMQAHRLSAKQAMYLVQQFIFVHIAHWLSLI